MAGEADAAEEALIVPGSTADIWSSLPLLIGIDVLFAWLVNDCLHDRIADAKLWSLAWWATTLFATLAVAATTAVIGQSLRNAFDFANGPRLIIDAEGITLPFTPPERAIRWADIASFYTDDNDMRGKRYRFLYIVMKRRRFSRTNPFARKDIALLVRQFGNTDDIDAATDMLFRYLEP